jgi:hypothetical protein
MPYRVVGNAKGEYRFICFANYGGLVLLICQGRDGSNSAFLFDDKSEFNGRALPANKGFDLEIIPPAPKPPIPPQPPPPTPITINKG